MKKTFKSLLLIFGLMLTLTACSSNGKAFLAESQKVQDWEGFTTEAKADVTIKAKDTEETIKIPMTIKGQQVKTIAKVEMTMDLKEAKKLASKEEAKEVAKFPDTINMEVFTDGTKVLIKKADLLKLAAEGNAKKLESIKEDYIALPVAMDGMNDATLKYLNSAEYKADSIKIMETALKGFSPKKDIQVDGNKFVYEANINEMTEDVKALLETIVKNWAETSKIVEPVIKKIDANANMEELNKAVAAYKKEEVNKSIDGLKETLEGSNLKYVTEFKDDSFKQDMKFNINVKDLFNMEMNMESENKKAENLKVTLPTSVKELTMMEYMQLFMPEQTTTPIIVRLNGEMVEFDQQPVIIESRTLIPVRAVLEKMGAEVKWDEVNKSVRAIKEDKAIGLSIGNKVALINNEKVEMDVPAQIIGDRTMIPLRFVSENLGYKVKFDKETLPGMYFIDIYNIDEAKLQEKIDAPLKALKEDLEANK